MKKTTIKIKFSRLELDVLNRPFFKIEEEMIQIIHKNSNHYFLKMAFFDEIPISKEKYDFLLTSFEEKIQFNEDLGEYYICKHTFDSQSFCNVFGVNIENSFFKKK